MFRTDFPDLQWLKKQISFGFRNNNLKGWPNVIINAKTRHEYRPEIKGTLSLFSNMSGNSICEADKHRVHLNEDTFFISNLNQSYSLEIDSTAPVETFNIHFAETLVKDVYQSLAHKSELWFNAEFTNTKDLSFYNKLYQKDDFTTGMMKQIKMKASRNDLGEMEKEEMLTTLLYHLISVHSDTLKQVKQVPVVKPSAKKEIYKRLSFALDEIHGRYIHDLTLEELAQTACLSKFHFIRLFKATFRLSPHQYILTVRMKKAAQLLKHTNLTTSEISTITGFENVSSFCRAFYRTNKYWPQEMRKSIPSI